MKGETKEGVKGEAREEDGGDEGGGEGGRRTRENPAGCPDETGTGGRGESRLPRSGRRESASKAARTGGNLILRRRGPGGDPLPRRRGR